MKGCKKKHDHFTSTTLTRLFEEHGVRRDRVKSFGDGEEWLLVGTLWVCNVTFNFLPYCARRSQLRGSVMMTLFMPVPEQYMINWFDKEDASTKKKCVCQMIWRKNDQAETVIRFSIRNIITCFSQREKGRGGVTKTKRLCIHMWDWADINEWHLLFLLYRWLYLAPFHWAGDISNLSCASTQTQST